MTPPKTRTILTAAIALLLLTTLTCTLQTTVIVTPTPEATAAGISEAIQSPTAPAPPTETPPPEPTTAAGCTLGARWVADVTVPDDTPFAPGTPFAKTWRVRNSGTCDWQPGTKLVFISGDPMGGPPAMDVPPLVAGAQTDVSVSLTAPAAPGTYRGNYQFQAPDGTRFGALIWVQIVVPAPATTAPPTEAPTQAPTTAPSPTPVLAFTPIIVPTIILPPLPQNWSHPISVADNRAIYYLRLTGPGEIRVRAEWTGSQSNLALIINGPGQTGYYARHDGPSPLEVSYTVTAADFAAGDTWWVSVASFGAGEANVTVRITYPSGSSVSPFTEQTMVKPGYGRAVNLLVLRGAGNIQAQANWSGTPANMALIINGPGQVGYYARKDGPSPLSVSYNVTASDFAAGDTWRVSLTALSAPGAEGAINLTYP